MLFFYGVLIRSICGDPVRCVDAWRGAQGRVNYSIISNVWEGGSCQYLFSHVTR